MFDARCMNKTEKARLRKQKQRKHERDRVLLEDNAKVRLCSLLALRLSQHATQMKAEVQELKAQIESHKKVRLCSLLALRLSQHAIQVNQELNDGVANLKEWIQAYHQVSALRFIFACLHVLWFRLMQVCSKKWPRKNHSFGNYK